MGDFGTAPVQVWKDKIKWYLETRCLKDVGRSTGNRWNSSGKFFRIHYVGNSRRDSKDDGGIKVWTWSKQRKDHLHVNVRWHSMGNTRKSWKLYGEFHECCSMCLEVPARMLVISGTWLWESGTHVSKPNGEWNKTAEVMMLNFAESGHPVFRATSAVERGELKSKENGKKSIHFNGSDETVELILRTYFCQSAQYLRSRSGHVQRIRSSFKKSNWRWDLGIFGNTEWDSQCKRHISEFNIIGTGGLVAIIRTEIRRTSWWSEIVETVLRRWFLKGNWKRTILHYNWRGIWGYADSMSRLHTTSKSENIPTERVDSFGCESRPSLGCEKLSSRRTLLCWYHDWILV